MVYSTKAAAIAPTTAPERGPRRKWPGGLGRLAAGYLLFGAGYIGYMTFIVALVTQVGFTPRAVTMFWVLLGIAGAVSGWVWAGLLRTAVGGSAAAVLFVLLAVAVGIPALTAATPALYFSGALFGLCMLSLVSAVTAAGRDAVRPGRWGRARWRWRRGRLMTGIYAAIRSNSAHVGVELAGARRLC